MKQSISYQSVFICVDTCLGGERGNLLRRTLESEVEGEGREVILKSTLKRQA